MRADSEKELVKCPRCGGSGKSMVNTLLTNAGEKCIACNGSGKMTAADAKKWAGYRIGDPIYPV
jgi:DnaJ-class molecular chaperone